MSKDNAQFPCRTPIDAKAAEKEKYQFDDLIRRIDHHAFILRTIPSDLFKTSALVQAGALFAFISVAASLHDKKELYEKLAFPVRLIVILLGIGVFVALICYIACYVKAHDRVVEARVALNNYLYNGKAIVEMPARSYRFQTVAFVVCLAQLALMLTAVGWLGWLVVTVMETS